MSSTDDELDSELRRLFQDERLEVRPRAGAEQAVVAGARRVRRRRAMLTSGGGTLAAVALVAGGLLIAAPGQRNAAAPPDANTASLQIEQSSVVEPPPAPEGGGTPSSEASGAEPSAGRSTRAAETPPPRSTSRDTPRLDTVPAGPVIGPDGYGNLKLGMSAEQVRATGRVAGDRAEERADGCMTYKFGDGALQVSGSDGLVGVYPARPVRTPEGVGSGSSLEEVRSVYPALSAEGGGYAAPAGSGAVYRIAMDQDKGVVRQVSLESRPLVCTPAG